MKKILAPLSLTICSFSCVFVDAASRPNIIVILCDDLGHGDLSCYGHPIIKTPNLDRLASSGIRFTDCYASSPVCSPSRAGLFTGRNPNRAGIYDWVSGGLVHLREQEITLPKLLKSVGYNTILAGKWHLNGKFNRPAEQPTPGDHGFDHWFATHNNASPNHRNPRNFVRNGIPVGPTQGYSSSIVVGETLHWLDVRDEDGPFACFLTFHEPHAPIASPPELVKEYKEHETIPGQAEYWANVTQIDRAVGELIEGLDQRKVTDNTLIFFTSDNGPEDWMRYPGVWNAHGTPGKVDGVPLRGMKLDVFEGGIRVCGILSWPSKVAKSRVVTEPICAVDILPTLCELTGVPIPQGHHLDGTSFLPLLSKDTPLERKTPLFWFYYNARGYAHFALREGDHMLLASRDREKYRAGTPYASDRFDAVNKCRTHSHQLYDLRQDPMEVVDLAKQQPERLEKMKCTLTSLLKDIQHDMPSWRPSKPPDATSR